MRVNGYTRKQAGKRVAVKPHIRQSGKVTLGSRRPTRIGSRTFR